VLSPAKRRVEARIIHFKASKAVRARSNLVVTFGGVICLTVDIGRVGTEWDVRIAPPGEERRTLVPDIAVVSYARFPRNAGCEAEFPTTAPDIVVEILSPGESTQYIVEKRRVYLASCTALVIEADPETELLTLHDSRGSHALRARDVLIHDALPDFAIPIASFFREP